MGLKEIKEQRKLLKDWRKELKKDGLDSDNFISLNHIRMFVMKELKDDDNVKHNKMLNFLKQNQVLVEDSKTKHGGFEDFEDNEVI